MASMDVAMGLIAGAGDARSSCMEAIELAKEGKFQEAREALGGRQHGGRPRNPNPADPG